MPPAVQIVQFQAFDSECHWSWCLDQQLWQLQAPQISRMIPGCVQEKAWSVQREYTIFQSGMFDFESLIPMLHAGKEIVYLLLRGVFIADPLLVLLWKRGAGDADAGREGAACKQQYSTHTGQTCHSLEVAKWILHAGCDCHLRM